MSEVSAHAVGLFVEALERRGLPVAPLFSGTPLADQRLSPLQRIAWDDYVVIAERFEAMVGGPEALEPIGREFFQSRFSARFVASVGLVLDVRSLYRTTHRFFGPLLFANLESDLREEEDRLEWALRIPEPYADCPQVFRISQGTFAVQPTMFGLPPARVTMDLRERSARYVIELPRRRGLLTRLRGRIGRRHADVAFAELRGQQEAMRRSLTELRATQEALRRSEARWRALVESATDFVLMVDPERRFQFVNHASYGLTVDDLIGRPITDFGAGPQFERAIDRALTRRESTAYEAEWRGPDTRRVWFSVQVSPVVEEGRTTGALLVVRDVTDARKDQERRLELERRMLEAQKLESLGVLAGGIAHDFNNLLAGIVSNAGMAATLLDDDVPSAPYLARVEQGAMRAAELIDQMLAYSGKGRFEVRPLDLSDLIEELSDLLGAALPKSARFHRHLRRGLPAIEGDPSQLQQVVMNLLTNAADALEEPSGEVTVRTGRLSLPTDAPDDLVPAELGPGEYVFVEIADTGTGMDADTLARIFDPFFTTKATGRGLGLAAVQGIVRRHRGALAVRSAPGEGTAFRAVFPASQRAAEPVDAPVVPRPGRGEGTVLVVDDEPTVLEGARSLLEHHGYGVLTASDGDEAIRVFREHADDIRVVLLDVTMPGRGGAEVFRAMRAIREDARIVLSSAYDARRAAGELEQEGLAGFLRKPYRPAALLEAVRSG